VNTDRTQTLGGVIVAQMSSLQDLKTYVTTAAIGMLSTSGFVWLVSDAIGRLGVIATYGAGKLLANERRQMFSPDSSTELGGVYVPAENPTPTPTPTPASTQPTSPASGFAPPPLRAPGPPSSVCALSTTAFAQGPGPRDGVSRPANVWSDPPSYAAHTGAGTGNSNGVTDGSSTTLVSLGQTLFTLFCVSVHEHAWMAGGYGVWGMERYLERFWTCLDWEAVRDSYVVYVRPKLLMLVARPHPRFRVGCAAGARLRVDRPVYMILLCSFTLKV
jgi:superoxide dismutase, Fe-Mn family